MLRLRYWLLGFFGAISILPVVLLALWVSKSSLDREFDDVKDRHLLLAHNIGNALSIYHRDVKAMFNLIVEGHNNWSEISGIHGVLDSMQFRHICIASTTSRYVLRQTSPTNAPCPEKVPEKRLNQFLAYAVEDKTVLTPVMAGPNDMNLIFVLRKSGSQLAIGALKTDYIVQLGKSISFGEKGHAAIVDQEGNVLAHPLDSWIAARKNIKKVSAVRRMLNGETGIEQFYSPALKGDMIAGLTAIKGTGWGVMIPQPVVELEQKAQAEHDAAMWIAGLSLLIMAFLSVFLAAKLSGPVERLTAAAEAASHSKEPHEAKIVESVFTPLEHLRAQTAFNDMVRAIRAGSREMKRLAYGDAVTGLANRTAFDRSVRQQMDHFIQKRGAMGVQVIADRKANAFLSCTLIYIDLDDFKAVNDTLGHHAGDELLRQIAKRLREVITDQSLIYTAGNDLMSEIDRRNFQALIARNGGDEFSIFIPHLTDEVHVNALADRISNAISLPLTVSGNEISVNASIGLARFPKDGRNLDVLTKKADIAMYKAKADGKNCYRLYHANIGEKTQAEVCRDVIVGINNDEFTLYYQPKVKVADGSVSCCEALVRWVDPARGLIRPDQFIPAIERHQATILLGEFVVQRAMDDAKSWRDAGHKMRAAVNISTHHFSSDDFVDKMMMFAFDRDIHPSLIELELTEESVLENDITGAEKIASLRELGFKISLDDFGRGYSNLTRLTELEFDVIKIDGPLVRNAVEDERARVVVEATLNMAQGLGCSVVAEGVETEVEAQLMRAMGCDFLQGYLFAKPMPEQSFTPWFKQHMAVQETAKPKSRLRSKAS